MNKSCKKRIYLCKFAKLVLTVHWRAILAIRNIKFLLWFVWVTSCFNSGTIQWSPLENVLVKAFWMVKHVTFPDFSGILVFEKFLKDPMQYSLVQSQQWRHQNIVPNMFTVNIKETRMTLLILLWHLYCC